MGLTVCPADTVAAPVEVVWEILTQPAYYSTWADAQLQHIEPEGPAVVGQTIHFTSKELGIKWPTVFKVEKVNAEKHQLGLYAVLPLGLRMRPHISCTVIDATTSRLQYGWDFIFPPGWWGWFLEKFGSKTFEASIEDSLQRLKRASEAAYRKQKAR